MKLSIRFVETSYIQQVWPMAEKHIKEAMEKGEAGLFPDWAINYNIDHVRAFVVSGSWLLVVAIDEENKVHGACTVSFANYPLHRIAFITAIGGKMITSQETFDQLKQLMKQYGATKIQGYCRDSVARLFQRYGFEPRNTLVEALI